MKQFLSICLVLAVVLGVCGCAGGQGGQSQGWSSGLSSESGVHSSGSASPEVSVPVGGDQSVPTVGTSDPAGTQSDPVQPDPGPSTTPGGEDGTDPGTGQEGQGSASGSAEQKPGEGETVVVPPESIPGVVTDTVKVRSGPGTTYGKIATLEKGTQIVILNTMNGWHQIACGQKQGYVAVQYVTMTDTPDAAGHVISDAAQPELLPLAKSYSFDRGVEAEYVMIHFISAVVLDQKDPYNMDTIRNIFVTNGLSVNYIIDRDGTVKCYVPEDRAAYHAGTGSYGGDERLTNKMNQYSIGIELAAMGSRSDMAGYLTASAYKKLDPGLIGYTDAQYDALKTLVTDICQRNGIPVDREHVIGHEDYSPKKTDPGELFDWDRLLG